ncbi:Ohr family peroxiredoxin [Paenarthrobacter sp. DKR-5]|uniref:Ohr family peroxiredoxin n=1 Tax=Paenarthrobacter sp. DKR-5 TaxID=2835535 RepID=UPI001BDC8B10|nr:Ohr family peroxiredoxin [Paenarthrobacter sp. DKR-5]MBT1002352.1 Ohr family peroxiredoxin [Paenarthrobacter sp. DKR-5]
MKTLYTATAVATGDGRNGRASTPDGRELGGSGEGTNPEQLFAAGYAACFHSALRLAGRRRRLDVSGSEVTAQVRLGSLAEEEGPAGGYGLGVTLQVALPAVLRPDAEELLGEAHRICPYSNATRGNIAVALELKEVSA